MVVKAGWVRVLAAIAVFLVQAPVAIGQQSLAGGAISPVGSPRETFLSAAQISGSVIVGIQLQGAVAKERPHLSGVLPAAWQGRSMCVRLTSSDGRYVAEQGYDIGAGWAGGLAALPYGTAYLAQLQHYSASDMAVRITLGNCSSPEATFAVAGWDIGEAGGVEGAMLMVNSFRADEVYLIDRASGLDLPCHAVAGGPRTSFDTYCPLPLHLLRGSGQLRIEVNRIRRGVFDPVALVDIEKAPF